MNKFEAVKEIVGLINDGSIYGTAEVSVDYSVLDEVIRTKAPVCTKDGAPTVKEIVKFLKDNENKEIMVTLMIYDPKREDFRVEIIGIAMDEAYAKVNTVEDMKFWKSFMDLKKGNCYMTEENETVGWKWAND